MILIQKYSNFVRTCPQSGICCGSSCHPDVCWIPSIHCYYLLSTEHWSVLIVGDPRRRIFQLNDWIILPLTFYLKTWPSGLHQKCVWSSQPPTHPTLPPFLWHAGSEGSLAYKEKMEGAFFFHWLPLYFNSVWNTTTVMVLDEKNVTGGSISIVVNGKLVQFQFWLKGIPESSKESLNPRWANFWRAKTPT